MTLTTHAVAGAFVGAVAAHNIPLAIAGAFMSHYVLDSIPHWDYHLASVKEDYDNPLKTDMNVESKSFKLDLVKIAIDCLLAVTLVLLFFSSAQYFVVVAAIIGAFFGAIPDALQFAYWRLRTEPIISLQKFHIFIAAKTRLQNRGMFWTVAGISFQLLIIITVGILSKKFFG